MSRCKTTTMEWSHMKNWDCIFDAISKATGTKFSGTQVTPIGSDKVSDTKIISDGREEYFIKRTAADAVQRLAAEVEGLEALRKVNAVKVPRVIVSGLAGAWSYIVLERLRFAPATDHSAAQLGLQLACQHRITDNSFGWDHDNFIGRNTQLNRRRTDWVRFWCDCRLRPQLDLAASTASGKVLAKSGERLLESCDAFFNGYRPTPSLLHGDLWAGNWGVLADGSPVVFDPAVYFGDREADLAMTELFGGFGPAFYSAYSDTWPLDSGYATRRNLYNLYHVLNHLNLFGASYLPQSEQLILSLLAEVH
jgi:fructosamine-3-kinase